MMKAVVSPSGALSACCIAMQHVQGSRYLLTQWSALVGHVTADSDRTSCCVCVLAPGSECVRAFHLWRVGSTAD